VSQPVLSEVEGNHERTFHTVCRREKSFFFAFARMTICLGLPRYRLVVRKNSAPQYSSMLQVVDCLIDLLKLVTMGD
jgi:hypothetical protein